MSTFRPRLAKRGVLPCKTCGEPHNAYWTTPNNAYAKRYGRLAPQWTSKDGHAYRPVGDPEGALARLIESGVVTTEQVMAALA